MLKVPNKPWHMAHCTWHFSSGWKHQRPLLHRLIHFQANHLFLLGLLHGHVVDLQRVDVLEHFLIVMFDQNSIAKSKRCSQFHNGHLQTIVIMNDTADDLHFRRTLHHFLFHDLPRFDCFLLLFCSGACRHGQRGKDNFPSYPPCVTPKVA